MVFLCLKYLWKAEKNLKAYLLKKKKKSLTPQEPVFAIPHLLPAILCGTEPCIKQERF
jgi:hypothetical protein